MRILFSKHADITLWQENSDCNVSLLTPSFLIIQVKMGVVVKIAIDEQKRIKKLLFEFYEFDFDCVSRKSPLGRARQKCILVSLYPEYH